MGKKLPDNFQIDKYGMHARLVKEEDAEFILKLRTDEKLGKYLHYTDNSVEKQRKWICEYKKRELAGIDYYFIFYYKQSPVGLNRIYNIHGDVFTTGSWIFEKAAPSECSIASAIIIREIAFDVCSLNFEDSFDGCHIDNKKVLKFNKMMGMKESGRIQDLKGIYVTLTLTKEDFEVNKDKILSLLNL